MDATSAIQLNQAATQQQLALSTLRIAAEGERQLADVLLQQVAPTPTSNPPGLGENVDTFA